MENFFPQRMQVTEQIAKGNIKSIVSRLLSFGSAY